MRTEERLQHVSKSGLIAAGIVIAAAVFPTPAVAQDSDALPESDGDEWAVTLELWTPRLGGKSILGPSPDARRIKLEDQLSLDDFEFVFLPDITFIRDNFWQIEISGFNFQTDHTGTFPSHAVFGDVTLTPGDPFDAEFELTTANIELAWWTCQLFDSNEGGNLDAYLAPAVGVRWIDADQRVGLVGGAESSTGGEWLAPYLAAHLRVTADSSQTMPVVDSFSILASVGAGPALGGDGGGVAHLRTGISCALSDHCEFTFGYRLIGMEVENGDYDLAAGLQGLYISGTLHF